MNLSTCMNWTYVKYMILSITELNRKKMLNVRREKEEEEALGRVKTEPAAATLVVPDTPKQAIATVSPEDISTPTTLPHNDATSDVNPATSSVLGTSATPSVTRCCGRPHKALTRTDYLDFPIHGTPEEKECWFKA